MNGRNPFKIAIVWRGDAEARRHATPQNNRFHRVFEELAAIGIDAEPAVYAEDSWTKCASSSSPLMACSSGSIRSTGQNTNDARCDVARCCARGTWVSAHPDVILKMGVKEVLHRTRHLGWGTDTHLYRTRGGFPRAFPSRLQSAGPRVLKQNRGNGGQGVWKVELHSQAGRRGQNRARVACAAREYARRAGAQRFHDALRGVFRHPMDVSSISRFSRGCPMA